MPSCCTLPWSEQGKDSNGAGGRKRGGSGLSGAHCPAQLEEDGLVYSGKPSSGEPETCSQFHTRPSSSRCQTSIDFLETWRAGQTRFP